MSEHSILGNTDVTTQARAQEPPNIGTFVVWGCAESRLEQLAALAGSHVEIVARQPLCWAQSDVTRNMNRFYGRDLRNSYSKADEVGRGSFVLLVVRDPEPKPGFHVAVGGELQDANLNLVRLKNEMRLTVKDIHPYAVHGSNSSREAMRDLVLLVGLAGAKEFLSASRISVLHPSRPTRMLGTRGWVTGTELAESLSVATGTILLSQPDALLNPDYAGDIDLLTVNALVTAGVANAERRRLDQTSYSFYVDVENRRRHLDCMQIGDGRLDSAWQREMYRTAILGATGLRQLDEVNLFFFTLYRGLVEKELLSSEISNLLEERLPGWMNSRSRFAGLVGDVASDPWRVLHGFLLARNYGTPRPAVRVGRPSVRTRHSARKSGLTLDNPRYRQRRLLRPNNVRPLLAQFSAFRGVFHLALRVRSRFLRA